MFSPDTPRKTDRIPLQNLSLLSVRFCVIILKNDSLYASIDSELHCAYSLINVYNIRYFNQIQLTVDVPPALKQFRIIKFLLQPLLENSILHGLDQPGTSLDIFLSICLTDDFLNIELSDNGKGMSPERLAEVMNYMQHPSEELPASSKGSFYRSFRTSTGA